jgi:pyruvate carboxylase
LSITRLLIANRGEIAIRASRAARERGISTVGIFTPEDRLSLHRSKTDEAYEIGEPGHPVRGYIDISAVVQAALATSCDAIYPGYGFLSESAQLAQACREAGLVFVGPTPEVLNLTGDKMAARRSAESAGLPVLQASGPVATAREAIDAAAAIGGPVFLKASAGGGGRGLRLLTSPEDIAASFDSARREAMAAFGDDTMFCEQAMPRPRHIEVQILGDGTRAVHLFERDCSVQRRHQKVVEMTPAAGLPEGLRELLCDGAVRYAEHLGYSGAGTVEYLLDAEGRWVFIEMNPRIQVEHTVTEEATGIDLVVSQLRIAGGETLDELGLHQAGITHSSAALQCRITTEDPSDGFRPDTGTVTAYRSPGGPGIRLDGGTFAGAEITPYFDSLLVKMTARGPDLAIAAQRARRALAEFMVVGVATNISFLQRILLSPELIDGTVTTHFIDEHPDLLIPAQMHPLAGPLLWLAERTVNAHDPIRAAHPDPLLTAPQVVAVHPGPWSPQVLAEHGPEALAARLRAHGPVVLTDTTPRDAHQSLLATRVRGRDLVAGAQATAGLLPGLFSLEAWGGATFDTALRFLNEDPWDRLARLREAAPGLMLQMLLRGRNAVGYTPYPDDMVRAFVAQARVTGVDVFRVFDALNDVEQIRPALQAVREVGGLAEAAVCYTGHLLDPDEQTYTLDYYRRVTAAYVEAGAHTIAIKDMAGLLRPAAADVLVRALRADTDLPVRLHTHDVAGGQLATLLAAIEAGVDGVDVASAPLAAGGSQPPAGALVAALTEHVRAPSESLQAVAAMEPYWSAVRSAYSIFESSTSAPNTGVYRTEVPGGQLSNLRQQAVGLGLGDRFEEVLDRYVDANLLLGRPVKVTPTSKVVGDLALWLASTGASAAALAERPEEFDLPESVLRYLEGELGTPAGGFVEPFTSRAVAGRPTRPAPTLSRAETSGLAHPTTRARTLTHLLYPGPAQENEEAAKRYGDLSLLPTPAYLHGLCAGMPIDVQTGPGAVSQVELTAIGELDPDGKRDVLLRVNGANWTVRVVDESSDSSRSTREKADSGDSFHVGATVPGVVTVLVAAGDRVTAGDKVAVIEAMKMEAALTSGTSGHVVRAVARTGDVLEAGDLVIELGP